MNIIISGFCIVGIIFMITFMFIGIWIFITGLKAYEQLKYKNYILEKIYLKLDTIANNKITLESLDEDSIIEEFSESILDKEEEIE